MSRAFADIAFTPAVKAAQVRHGSREANRALEQSPQRGDRLRPREMAFIAARDGFFQATVGATGWPYVQFRGGPPGFLKVLDERTVGYADFRGNRQYLSVGNLADDGRIALILLDQARRQRLKLWGRARIVDAAEDVALIERLAIPDYPARVERAVLIGIEAFDWNCPQHITQRLSAAELVPVIEPLRRRIAELEAENARLRGLPLDAR
jgi:predicted pyridoxine 5'-phosphate oxidase superfamily flavin-nucleotide-binding protein